MPTTPKHIPWGDLSPAQQGRLRLLLISLDEFQAAHEYIGHLLSGPHPNEPLFRFMVHGLNQYLYAYYPDSQQMGAYGVLLMIGREDLTAPTEAILTTVVGPKTLREHNAAFRDKVIAHPSYRLRTIERAFFDELDLGDERTATLYQRLIAVLFARTLELRRLLRHLYPQAAGL